jgi:hypothetical protein
MATIKITDECLAPDREIRLSYSGPDPWGVAKKIEGTSRMFFHLSSVGTANTEIKWDVVGDNITFLSKWWIKKGLSGGSATAVGSDMYGDIKIQGWKNKKTNVGEFQFRMWAQVQTEVSGWSPVLKPFWSLYSYLFYDKVRRKYIETCNTRCMQFRNELKKHFNLEAHEVASREGTYG